MLGIPYITYINLEEIYILCRILNVDKKNDS